MIGGICKSSAPPRKVFSSSRVHTTQNTVILDSFPEAVFIFTITI